MPGQSLPVIGSVRNDQSGRSGRMARMRWMYAPPLSGEHWISRRCFVAVRAVKKTHHGNAHCLSGEIGSAPGTASIHQAVELPRILAGDLAGDLRREVAELLGDVFRGFGPRRRHGDSPSPTSAI